MTIGICWVARIAARGRTRRPGPRRNPQGAACDQGRRDRRTPSRHRPGEGRGCGEWRGAHQARRKVQAADGASRRAEGACSPTTAPTSRTPATRSRSSARRRGGIGCSAPYL